MGNDRKIPMIWIARVLPFRFICRRGVVIPIGVQSFASFFLFGERELWC